MNNSENNNEGLNTISLGNIDNNAGSMPPLNDIPPIMNDNLNDQNIENIDNLDMTVPINTNAGVIPESAQSMSPVQPVAPVDPVASINNYEVPEAINDFVPPTFNDIGTVPPLPDNNGGVIGATPNSNNPGKKKKNGNKIIFILIMVLALTAVGVGVYLFLHMARVNSVLVKNVEIEVNSELSSNINDYATFKSIDSSTCSLDTTNIKDTSKVGEEYTFKVVCGENVYTGKAKIVDKTPPVVEIQEVKVAKDSEVKPEDFIVKCEDASKCSYSFKDEEKVKGFVKEAGAYKVDIIVKDEAGNQEEVTGTLNVTNTVASLYLVCSKQEEVLKMGLEDSKFTKTATRVYTFKMSESDYKTFKDNNNAKKEVTYKDITGTPKFDDANFTLVIEQILSYEDMNKEAKKELPLEYSLLKEHYEKDNYSCSIGF